jgi:hypothetical protein
VSVVVAVVYQVGAVAVIVIGEGVTMVVVTERDMNSTRAPQ